MRWIQRFLAKNALIIILFSTCLFTASLFFSDAVYAQGNTSIQSDDEIRPWYFSFGGSVGFPDEPKVSSGPNTKSSILALDRGYSAGLSLGYAWERVRVEASYTFSEYATSKLLETETRTAEDFVPITGDLKSNAYMINGFFEFPEVRDWLLTPYIGAGFGIVAVKADEISIVGPNISSRVLPRGVKVTDTKATYGFQLMVGTAIHLSLRTSLDIGYRYFQTLGTTSLRDSSVNGLFEVKPLTSHSIDARIRVAF